MSYPNCNPLMRRAQANFPKVLSSGPNGRSEVDLGPSLEHSRTAMLRRFSRSREDGQDVWSFRGAPWDQF